jgi:hypothetical protein
MIISLSGFEGCGKTTLVNQLQTQHNHLVVPETARLLIPLREDVFKDSRDDLSYHSFSAYLNSLNFIFQNVQILNNNALNVVFDRNMIDSLTFLQMYSKEQEIKIEHFQSFIDRYTKENNRETLFDKVYLIEHSKNNLHIKNNILNDDVRQYSNSGVYGYKNDASIWESQWLENYHNLNNFSKELVLIQAYPDNPKPINSIIELLPSTIKTNKIKIKRS